MYLLLFSHSGSWLSTVMPHTQWAIAFNVLVCFANVSVIGDEGTLEFMNSGLDMPNRSKVISDLFVLHSILMLVYVFTGANEFQSA